MTKPDPKEAEDFLRAHPQVESFHSFLTDPSGVQRGKVLRREELVRAYLDGRPLPGSILGLDITGADVEETGLVWEDGDADRLCWPVAGSLTAMPWAARPSAQFLITSHEQDGRPSPGDPRHALKRVIDALAADGYTAVAAVELEFYLLDRESALAGKPQAPIAPNGWQPKQLQAYLMQDLEDFAPFLNAVYAGGAEMGLPHRTLISEYAPGQLEIVLQHQADALKAADQAILHKRLVKGTAEKLGYVATFMAKPFQHLSGSGTHLHVSLADKNGRNVFAADDPTGSPLLRQGIAGLKATMAESMGIFAPNANSFRRFRKNSYAPVAPTWGVNNRSVSLRIPSGGPETRHVEHRVCGADANPYLALAAVLAGLHKGIREKLDPGAMVEGNGYAQAPAKSLPSNWYEAIAATRQSQFLKDALGERFMEIYCAIKEGELDRFMAEVNERDYAWYLRLA